MGVSEAIRKPIPELGSFGKFEEDSSFLGVPALYRPASLAAFRLGRLYSGSALVQRPITVVPWTRCDPQTLQVEVHRPDAGLRDLHLTLHHLHTVNMTFHTQTNQQMTELIESYAGLQAAVAEYTYSITKDRVTLQARDGGPRPSFPRPPPAREDWPPIGPRPATIPNLVLTREGDGIFLGKTAPLAELREAQREELRASATLHAATTRFTDALAKLDLVAKAQRELLGEKAQAKNIAQEQYDKCFNDMVRKHGLAWVDAALQPDPQREPQQVQPPAVPVQEIAPPQGVQDAQQDAGAARPQHQPGPAAGAVRRSMERLVQYMDPPDMRGLVQQPDGAAEAPYWLRDRPPPPAPVPFPQPKKRKK
ncbi:unnamed protein product, partial [Mesorhabditis spiculigera]